MGAGTAAWDEGQCFDESHGVPSCHGGCCLMLPGQTYTVQTLLHVAILQRCTRFSLAWQVVLPCTAMC